VTIPNGELANKNIQNVARRPHIRRVVNLDIAYGTPPDKVARALEIVKELLRDHEGIRPDFPPRVYFNEFDDRALNLTAIYWYHPPNYWDFMAFNERFNLEVLRRFRAEGIEFVAPPRDAYLPGGMPKG
jgi:MscS family membrane protein